MDGYSSPLEKLMPSLCLNDEQFPQVKKLETGKVYKAIVMVKVEHKSESDRDGKVRTHTDLEIMDIKIGNSRKYEKEVSGY